MKLSAFLAVSVPIVAASQVPALAAGPASTGGWLQASIASLATTKAAKPAAKRVAHANPAATVRLRAFKPGRYLPSEKDLRRAAMVSQQAQYDYSADQPSYGNGLSGQVSTAYAAAPRATTVYDQYAMNSGYANSVPAPQTYAPAPRIRTQKKAIGQRAPRVMPNQMPMLPEQLTQAPVVHPMMIPDPPVQRQVRAPFPVSMPVAPFPQPAVQQQQQFPQQGAANFGQSDFSPEELAEMHRRVESNPPTGRMSFNGDMTGQATDNPANGTGQPPFPLNFFGGNAMQVLSQGQHMHRPSVSPARFGSWHGGAGLAEAGFHSYVARRRPTVYDYVRTAPPTALSSKRKVDKRRTVFSAPPAMAQSRQKQIVVATYPAYQSARGMTY